MTADEAIGLAAYQRPGVRLIVGATEAREEFGISADDLPLWTRNALGIKSQRQYPEWQQSFAAYDLYRRLGWWPSFWARSFGVLMQIIANKDLTAAEWAWLDAKSTSLDDAQAWLAQGIKDAIEASR